MKHGKRTAATALALMCAAGSAYAADGRVCLDTVNIRSTRIVDDSTILFEMAGGKTYQNKLTNRCTGLYLENGFAYDASPSSQICSNLNVIYVLNRGTPCLLGEFTPYEKPPKS